MSTQGGIKKFVESKPGPRCVCGKSSFRSRDHARAHARGAHSERMRIYLCVKVGGVYHLTNNEKKASLHSLAEGKKDLRGETRRMRYESRRLCASYDHGVNS